MLFILSNKKKTCYKCQNEVSQTTSKSNHYVHNQWMRQNQNEVSKDKIKWSFKDNIKKQTSHTLVVYIIIIVSTYCITSSQQRKDHTHHKASKNRIIAVTTSKKLMFHRIIEGSIFLYMFLQRWKQCCSIIDQRTALQQRHQKIKVPW